MAVDLFAGIPVTDFERARAWYEQLFGGAPAFLPTQAEAVWELAEHRFVYIVLRPEEAGHGVVTLFAEDFDARLEGIAGRGLRPTALETYSNGVRKATFHDPDGNEIGFGGSPASEVDGGAT